MCDWSIVYKRFNTYKEDLQLEMKSRKKGNRYKSQNADKNRRTIGECHNVGANSATRHPLQKIVQLKKNCFFAYFLVISALSLHAQV